MNLKDLSVSGEVAGTGGRRSIYIDLAWHLARLC